jgi:hypothetical protein
VHLAAERVDAGGLHHHHITTTCGDRSLDAPFQ